MAWRAPAGHQAPAERHEAAALAVDEGAPVRCRAHTVEESTIGRETCRVQLGIAARQIHRRGARRRRLIGER